MSEKTNQYISYGFRIRERLPFGNGAVRVIITRAWKIFKLLSEKKIDELMIVLENDKQLDDALEKWVAWGESR